MGLNPWDLQTGSLSPGEARRRHTEPKLWFAIRPGCREGDLFINLRMCAGKPGVFRRLLQEQRSRPAPFSSPASQHPSPTISSVDWPAVCSRVTFSSDVPPSGGPRLWVSARSTTTQMLTPRLHPPAMRRPASSRMPLATARPRPSRGHQPGRVRASLMGQHHCEVTRRVKGEEASPHTHLSSQGPGRGLGGGGSLGGTPLV